jgi:hypothetical protein
MTVLRFSVFGKPQPAGSKKGFVNPKTGRVIITEDAKNSKPWRQQVAGAAEHAAGIAGDGWAVQIPFEALDPDTERTPAWEEALKQRGHTKGENSIIPAAPTRPP